MSEIRSQATPVRDELAEKVFDLLTRVAEVGTSDRNVIAHGIAMGLEDAGWSKPRTVTSAAELKALPTCSLIRGLEREGQRSGDVFEKVGPDHWLCLDPGDRFDGEETTPSHAIVLIYKAGIRVLFTPGEAG
ncbi:MULTISPECIES: hypothetical protein [unclassified Rhodococcus (in: high G+C Gram-positive bacteria)]|uniref:hypothetical protein n=1 Tax=unclassified Rhodococcus (in: high G+C Gram-positive bacteria) TaxID=192944 RepID=UPI00096A7B1A|nr:MULTISPECIES: hypothetical protein [unclassified Rhodococcus (in: high G+C Gram-positive bacteria)]